MWALKGVIFPYARWFLANSFLPNSVPTLPQMPVRLRAHAEFAADRLQRSPLEISGTMRKHQLKLADRQCRMSEVSSRIQKLVVILCTSLHAAQIEDEVVQTAADILCQNLTHELTGARPSDRDFRAVTQLGEAIADGGFTSIAGLTPDEILMPY